MIDESLLLDFGAKKTLFQKGEIIIKQGESARYYHQIATGSVKMNNFNDDGKEFIQGIFVEGDSFGEPPLLIEENYPANGIAIVPSEILMLTKEKFLELLRINQDIHFYVTRTLAKRLYFKTIMASEISSQYPEHRVLKLIDYFKTRKNKIPKETSYMVEITRQQIADLTGLRVETVIRAIKSLEKKGEVMIKDRKVFR